MVIRFSVENPASDGIAWCGQQDFLHSSSAVCCYVVKFIVLPNFGILFLFIFILELTVHCKRFRVCLLSLSYCRRLIFHTQLSVMCSLTLGMGGTDGFMVPPWYQIPTYWYRGILRMFWYCIKGTTLFSRCYSAVL